MSSLSVATGDRKAADLQTLSFLEVLTQLCTSKDGFLSPGDRLMGFYFQGRELAAQRMLPAEL